MTYVNPYKRMFYFTAILSIVLAVVALVRPILIQQTIDENIKTFDANGLLIMTMILIGFLLLESVLEYLFGYLGNLLGQKVIRDLRNQVFQHVLNFRLKHFDNTPIGQLVTRTVSDIETIY